MKEQSSSKGFAVLSTASLICKLLSFIYVPVQTLLVHDSGNGVINAGFKLYLFIYSLTNAGLPVIISKFVSEQVALGDYRSARKIFRSASVLMLSFGVVSTGFTFFSSGWLAASYCRMPNAKFMFMVIAPTFLFTSVSCSLRGYFQGRRDMTPTAVSQVIEQIINSGCTLLFEVLMCNYADSIRADRVAYAAAGSAAATVLGAIGSAVFLSFLYYVVYRNRRQREIQQQTLGSQELSTAYIYRQILKFSLPAIINCIAASAIDLIDTGTVKGFLMKGGLTSVRADALFGIYAQKYQRLMTLATMFVAPLVTAMIPALSTALAKKNVRYFRYKIRESYKLIYIVVLPVVSGLTFLAKPIITVICTTQNSGSLLVIAGTWVAVLMAVQSIQAGILLSLNLPMIAPVTTIVGMLAKLLCNAVLIPIGGINIYGAVIGNVLAWAVSIALNRIFIRRAMKSPPRTIRYLFMPGLSAIVMGAVCLGVFEALYRLFLLSGRMVVSNDIAVLMTVPIGAVLYFILMIRWGGLSARDIGKLPMGTKLLRLLKKLPMLRGSLAAGGI